MPQRHDRVREEDNRPAALGSVPAGRVLHTPVLELAAGAWTMVADTVGGREGVGGEDVEGAGDAEGGAADALEGAYAQSPRATSCTG